MGALDYKTRRHRRNRLAAELAATYSPRRHFRLGQDVGWHWQFDNPNDLYRRRNRATNTGFTLGTTGGVPTDWIERGLITGRKTVDATTQSGFCMRVTGGGGTVGGSDDVRLTTVTGLTIGATHTVRFKAKNAGGTPPIRIAMASTSADIAITSSWASYTFNAVATSATNGIFFGAAVAGAIYDVTDIEVLSQSDLSFPYQPVSTWAQAYLDAVGADRIYAWKDTAGDPVTAVGEGIGLLLGREYGGARTQFSTNDSFASAGTGWSGQTGWSFATGSASVNSALAGTTYMRTSAATVVGTLYEVTFTVSSYTSGSIGVAAGTAVAGLVSAVGTYTRFITASTTDGAGVYGTSTNTVATVTRVTVRAVPGTHLTQATGTAKPTLSARVNLLLNTATMSTQNVTTVATGYRLRFEGAGTVTLSGTVTAGPLSAGTHNVTATAGTLTLTVSGSVTLADLRTADDAAKNIPAYQRVGATAADHDTDGFPHYALFDGTDDGLSSVAPVEGSVYDKLVHVDSITRLSDATQAYYLTYGATPVNTGEYGVTTPTGAGLQSIGAVGRSTSGSTSHSGTTITGLTAAPTTFTTAVSVDWAAAAGAEVRQWINEVALTGYFNPSQANTGTFGAAKTLHIGSLGSTSLRFNGRFYGSTGRFGPMSDSERNNLTRWWQKRIGTV